MIGKTFSRLSFVIVIILLSVMISFPVLASGNQGEGAGGDNWTYTGCDDATYVQNVRQCPNDKGEYNGRFGGGSWHIFKTTNYPLDNPKDVTPTAGRPMNRRHLIGSGYPGKGPRVEQVCPADRYDYYFAYVYDGWYGQENKWNDKKPMIYYGPLAWGEYYDINDEGIIHRPLYHNAQYNLDHPNDKRDHVWDDFKSNINNKSVNMNGWRARGQHPLDGRNDDKSYRSKTAEAAYRYWMGISDDSTLIPDGTGFFCAGAQRVKLTGVAVERVGNSVTTSSSQTSTVVDKGKKASISKPGLSSPGFTYVGWAESLDNAKAGSYLARTNASSATYVSGSSPFPTYNVKSLTSDKTVYAVYEKNTFAGSIVLSGDASGAIEYTTSSKGSPRYVKVPCSRTKGCSVVFNDYVMRIAGGGTTNYTVSRTSNFTSVVPNNNNVASGKSGNVKGEKVATDPSTKSFKLYPGMVVCEKLSFKVYSTDTNNTGIILCAAAEGDAQPPDPGNSDTVNPSDDTSYYNIKVSNKSVTKYNNYQKVVYAKPGDTLNYWASYNPVLQYVYYLIPERISIDGSKTVYPASGKNTSATMGNLFNAYVGSSLGNWKSAIRVYGEGFSYGQNYFFKEGDTTIQYNKDKYGTKMNNDYKVTASEVGRSLNEKVDVNVTNKVMTTPKQVTFKVEGDNGYNLGNIITKGKPKTASALVPYNYQNETHITSDNKIVYAGEVFNVAHNYIIKPKENSLTTNNPSEEKYATTVGNPKWQLEFCVGKNDCDAGNYSKYHTDIIVNNDLGSNKHDFSVTDMSKGKEVGLKTDINIPDVAAGTQICVRSVIYPATSGSDDNYNNPDGYGSSSSDRACFVVAKRPSLQVWGGNIYSRGRITTATSTKYTLDGYGDYKIEEKGDPYVFGSFGELGLIASGEVRGLASGASTGYASINADGTLIPDPFSSNNSSSNLPGGGNDSSICNRSPLTFANTPCMNGAVGKLGKTTTTSNADKDKTKVLEKFVRDVEPNVGGTVTLNDDTKTQPDGTYYYYSTEDLTIGDGSYLSYDNPRLIKKSTIQMVHSDKTIYINDNLAYEGEYNDYSELPKLIIYGKNVVIDCRVTRIEALIVADERVVTCNNYEGDINNLSDTDLKNNVTANINQSPNANQLKVNGAIIAKTLIANRTYGAATGANSIIPAEIINFDPSLYMWGNLGDDDDNDNGDLEVTLTKELAPRR